MIAEAASNDLLDDDLVLLIEEFANLSKDCATFDDISEEGMLILKMIRKLARSGDDDRYFSWILRQDLTRKISINDIAQFSVGAMFLDERCGVSDKDKMKFEQIDKLISKLSVQFAFRKDELEIEKLSEAIIALLREIYGISSLNGSPFTYASLAFRCKSLRCYNPYNTHAAIPVFVQRTLLYSLTGYVFDLQKSIHNFLRFHEDRT